MAASREELVKQHDAILVGMHGRMAAAKRLAKLQGQEFDAEKWVTGVSSKGQFKYGPPYYVSHTRAADQRRGMGSGLLACLRWLFGLLLNWPREDRMPTNDNPEFG